MDSTQSRLNSTREADTVVIGGGVVGLSCAIEVARRGTSVTIVERVAAGEGCATGSAGFLVPSHALPLAEPGAVREFVRSIFTRFGAVSVRPTVRREDWWWYARFLGSCSPRHVAAAAPALKELGDLSLAVLDEWATDVGVDVERRRDGLLDVYGDSRRFDAALERADHLRDLGIVVESLDGDATRAIEPALNGTVRGALRFPDDQALHPQHLLRSMTLASRRLGVQTLSDTDVTGLRAVGSDRSAVETSRGDLIARQVILAAGANSRDLQRSFGVRIPVLGARGMSITARRPEVGPTSAMLLGERHVAVAPMGDQFRISGWFQLGGNRSHPTRRGLRQLEQLARTRVDLDEQLTEVQHWAGIRPVSADGVPIIGLTSGTSGARTIIASGHGMTGLSFGPGTGRLVAQLIDGEELCMATAPFDPRRF